MIRKCLSVAALLWIAGTPLGAATDADAVLEALLAQKMSVLRAAIEAPEFNRGVRAESAKHKDLPASLIASLDRRWRDAVPGDDFSKEFIAGFTTNACAQALQRFQAGNREFREIFITDDKGLNLCQTNTTSDYLQADEDWWQKARAGGKGHAYHGDIEYDESSRSQSIALYLPVLDPADGRLLGICKAVLDLQALADDL